MHKGTSTAAQNLLAWALPTEAALHSWQLSLLKMVSYKKWNKVTKNSHIKKWEQSDQKL